MNYSKMRKRFPHARPDVLVTTTNGSPYSEVLDFLRERLRILQQFFPEVVFGHKGNSYQTKVLEDAGISKRVNLETLDRPSEIRPSMPRISIGCPFHKGDDSKCAWTPIIHYVYGGA